MGMGWGLSSSSDIIIHEFGEKVKFRKLKDYPGKDLNLQKGV